MNIENIFETIKDSLIGTNSVVDYMKEDASPFHEEQLGQIADKIEEIFDMIDNFEKMNNKDIEEE